MSRVVDRWQAREVDNNVVANGQTLISPILSLDAAAGVSVQVVCTNGAAGSVYVDSTNQDGVGAIFVSQAAQAVSANGSLFLNFGPSDQPTNFAQMRVRFVATAAGNITVSTNVRRYSY